MADEQAVEHIFLESSGDGEDQDAATPRRVNAKLEQRSERRGHQARYVIFNDAYVAVRIKAFPRYRARYWLSLACLDPQPRRGRRIDWRWLGGGLTSLAAAALAVRYQPPAAWSELMRWWPSLVVVLATGGLVAMLMFVQRFEHRVTFYSRYARTPMLSLLANRPSRTECQRFTADLQARAERAQDQRAPDKRTLLNAELREHRRLRDEGIIDAAGYAKAKAALLALHG